MEVNEKKKRKFRKKLRRKIYKFEVILPIMAFLVQFPIWFWGYGLNSIIISMYLTVLMEILLQFTYIRKWKIDLYSLRDYYIEMPGKNEIIIKYKIKTSIGDMYKIRCIRPKKIKRQGMYLKIKGDSTYIYSRRGEIPNRIRKNPNNETVYIPQIMTKRRKVQNEEISDHRAVS